MGVNKNQTKNKYGEKKILKICSICLVVSLIISFIHFYKFNDVISAFGFCAELILTIFFYFMWYFYRWQKNIELLMREYRDGNIISGGLAILSALAFPFIITQILANYEIFTGAKDFFSNMSSLVIAITPAFIALMGVQYTVAIQERNRREDLRLGAKPFLDVQCCVWNTKTEDLQNNESVIGVHLKIKNIGSNIMIPISVESKNNNEIIHKFDYKPLVKDEVITEKVQIINLGEFASQYTVYLRYEDIYKNEYLAEIEFLLMNSYELSKTRVLSDKLCINESNEKR